MPIILHKFRNHIVSPDTEILILGTFHPDINTGADFFYGRPRNYLWRILPICFDAQSLKDAPIALKQQFMENFHIDFADIIHSVKLSEGEEINYGDDFIDNKVVQWKDIVQIIYNLPKLKAVYFTRKTFTKVPNIELTISQIRNYCVQKCIRFCFLETPARYANERKINSWQATIVEQTTCL